MKSYKTPRFTKTSLKVISNKEGETLEQKIERIVRNGEPIKDGAPLVYTERKDGVKAGYNIRTDRWDLAIDAMDKYQQSITAERENRYNKPDTGTSENGSTDTNLGNGSNN